MKITYARNRLRDALDEAEPMMAQTALGRAENLLTQIEMDCVTRLDELLAELPSQPVGEAEAIRRQIRAAYDTARKMIGVGTIAKLPEVDVAARSLCDAADGLLVRGKHEWEPIRLHIDALRLMRHPDMGEGARQQLLAGLEALRGRFAATPPQDVPRPA